MWEWSKKLKLAHLVGLRKKALRPLPLTETEFEADFFLDPEFSTKRQETWTGAVVEREQGVLAWEDVRLPPPTVNYLATLLAHAMLRPANGVRQRPSTIHLRDRPQWQELLPHLRQLRIKVILGDDLPMFDEAVIAWMQHSKTRMSSAMRSKPPFGGHFQSENVIGLRMQWNSWNGQMRCSRERIRPAKCPSRPTAR